MKILFLDCDGTIREPLSGAKFISHPRDQQIIPRADKALAHYHKRGWVIVGISNQGGVGAGHKSLEAAIAEQEYTLGLFPEMTAIYFCPDFEGKRCIVVGHRSVEHFLASTDADRLKWQNPELWQHRPPGAIISGLENGFSFRKPGSGMLSKAIEDFSGRRIESFLELMDRRLADCWYVGDRPEDKQCAAAAGVNFLWAEVWRSRFLPGMHEHAVTPIELEFLEGIKPYISQG